VRTESAQWDLTAEEWQAPRRITTEQYRPDGKIAASQDQWGGAEAGSTISSYDDAGVLIETLYWNGDAPAGRAVYEYDGGRLMRAVQHNPDGSQHVSQEFAYAPDGSHTRILHFPEMFGTMDVICGLEGVDFSVSAPGVRTMTTSYDHEDRVAEVLLKNGEGEIQRQLTFDRDECGRAVNAQLLLGAQPLVSDLPAFGAGAVLMTVAYAWDEQGRQTEMVQSLFGIDEKRETYRYDDRGNRTETTSEEQRCEGQMGDDGTVERGTPEFHRSQTRFDYKYDAQGNWIERVTLQRFESNPDFTFGSIERREIAYYVS
jgi:hypothetical protein